ncbi:NAD-dependent succinate-semialdehyde dehydrogenase [Nitratireductor rhodophyticola]|uniref:NAD-dependent succinate-semialdehyde dehydrogenase n=1 Tax=Nitratireductor rhodophyticola TaxID=2854036 RepID=UPI0032D917B0
MQLDDPSLLETRAYVSGEWYKGAATFPVHDPATGEILAHVTDTPPEDVKNAIEKAYTAQKEWAGKTGKERAGLLRRWHDLMIGNADDLGTILCAEMGKPLAEAKAEILYGASFLEWFSEEAKRVYGDTIPGHQADKRILVLKQPVGVVGAITPWNFPNAMIARKVAPALAAGCSIVVRPAELTPLSATAMAVLAERAGLPAGVFNVVPNTDAAGTGQEMCTNPKIAKITFTGSTRVGQILMRQAADGVKKLSLELGGNAPFIVFNDADLDAAVEGAMIAKFRNSGQTCVCVNRIYAQTGIYDAFAERLATAIKALRPGNGFHDGVTVGPLINEAAILKVEQHLSDAVSKGAQVMTGGKRIGGTFFEPTLVAHVPVSAQMSCEETFGPVAPLFRFETEEEVIALANDSALGLAGYFYANDLACVWRVAEALEVGMVGVNTGLISTEVAPFGGIKQSGLGREGSKYGLDDYLNIKYVCIGGIK